MDLDPNQVPKQKSQPTGSRGVRCGERQLSPLPRRLMEDLYAIFQNSRRLVRDANGLDASADGDLRAIIEVLGEDHAHLRRLLFLVAIENLFHCGHFANFSAFRDPRRRGGSKTVVSPPRRSGDHGAFVGMKSSGCGTAASRAQQCSIFSSAAIVANVPKMMANGKFVSYEGVDGRRGISARLRVAAGISGQ